MGVRSIKIVAACDGDFGMGYQGKLPWPSILEDMKHFRALTLHNSVIMGRRTWESLPGMLEHRLNVVLSSTMTPQAFGPVVVSNITDAMFAAGSRHVTWIIGGRAVYEQFVHMAQELWLTEVKGIWPADVRLPGILLDTFPVREVVAEWEGATLTRRNRK